MAKALRIGKINDKTGNSEKILILEKRNIQYHHIKKLYLNKSYNIFLQNLGLRNFSENFGKILRNLDWDCRQNLVPNQAKINKPPTHP